MMNQNSSGFLSSIPMVTKNLIIINLLFWVASFVLPKVGIDLVQLFGLHFPGVKDFYPFQFVTYMFMHDTHSFAHVLFNMFGVYMFGRVLENVWGPKRFLTFYMVTGIGAGITQELVWLYSVHSFASANGVTLAQLVAGDPSLNYRCFGFRVRYFAGVCHVIPECPVVSDVHPDSYQSQILRDLLRIGRIVYGGC